MRLHPDAQRRRIDRRHALDQAGEQRGMLADAQDLDGGRALARLVLWREDERRLRRQGRAGRTSPSFRGQDGSCDRFHHQDGRRQARRDQAVCRSAERVSAHRRREHELPPGVRHRAFQRTHRRTAPPRGRSRGASREDARPVRKGLRHADRKPAPAHARAHPVEPLPGGRLQEVLQ